MSYKVVVVGASWGGISALGIILKYLPSTWTCPIIVIQHQHSLSEGLLKKVIQPMTHLNVVDIDDKLDIQSGNLYLAPPNYHVYVELDYTFGLSLDPQVNFSRPSIDVTFESVAKAYHKNVIGKILTGASADGANGLKAIYQSGGFTIAQLPSTAEVALMPEAAILTGCVHEVLAPELMSERLLSLLHKGS